MSTVAGIWPVSNADRTINNFPLISSKIHYDLVDVQSLTTLVLTYASNASVATEVKYVCPLPSDASVCSFKAVIDGKRTIKGIVKDKVKAKEEYDAAVSQGRTAALLEQNNVEIFQVSLGNIHPKQVIEIYISLASLIAANGELDSLQLVFPSVITRRYGASPNDLLWLGRPVKSTLDFSISVQMASYIKSITSPSHPISVTLGSLKADSESAPDPFKAYISLTSQDHLDKDIVVVITCQGLDRPRCTVESYSPEEGGQEFTDAYSLTLVPRFELPPLLKQEYIFLVDRSGSMKHKMNAVRDALQIMLRSLPSNNTTFNIFSFGSRYDSLWPSSVPYGAESLKVAATHVDEMQANYGGTEIQNALQAVLQTHVESSKAQDVPLTVFILTDGETYDLSGVQSTIASHVEQHVDKENFMRVFCMGIGNSVSRAMCDMIARVGQGAVVYVGEKEKPDKKLMALLRAARGPVVTNISVDWGVATNEEMDSNDDGGFELVPSEHKDNTNPVSLFDENAVAKDNVSLGPLVNVTLPPPPKVQQAPTNASLQSLYPGFRMSIFAIIKRDNGGNSAPTKVVRVKGVVQGRPVVLEVPITPATTPVKSSNSDHLSNLDNMVKFLHVLAARALVQRFEDEGKKTGVMSDVFKAEVLRVALRYGIASSETSFVAVDEKDAQNQVAVPIVGGFATGNTKSSTAGLGKPTRKPGMGALPTASRSGRSHEKSVDLSPSLPTKSVVELPSIQSQLKQLPVTQSLYSELFTVSHNSPLPTVSIKGGFEGLKRVINKASIAPPTHAQPEELSLSIGSVARYQTFEGSFDGSLELHKLLIQQSALPTLPDVLQQLNLITASALDLDVLVNTIWRTVICIVFLKIKFPDDEGIWESIVEKGESWINNTLAKAAGVSDVSAIFEALKKEARKYIL